jgi:hypothetical protein
VIDALLSGNRPTDLPGLPNLPIPPKLEDAPTPPGSNQPALQKESPRGASKQAVPQKRPNLSSKVPGKCEEAQPERKQGHVPKKVRNGGAAWEGPGLSEPPPLPPDALAAPTEENAQLRKRTYFRSVNDGGEKYCVGDAAEVHFAKDASSRIVQLTSLWESAGSGTGGGVGRMRATCRLFLRPEETEFPAMGLESKAGLAGAGRSPRRGSSLPALQELFLSNVEQEVHVAELKRKVHVARSAEADGPSTGFLCRFFYDAEREMLSKLKP